MTSEFKSAAPAFQLAEYLSNKEIPCKLYKESGSWFVYVGF